MFYVYIFSLYILKGYHWCQKQLKSLTFQKIKSFLLLGIWCPTYFDVPVYNGPSMDSPLPLVHSSALFLCTFLHILLLSLLHAAPFVALFHVAITSCCTFLCVGLFSCCTCFVLHSFIFTFSVLHFFHIALFPSCTFFVSWAFYVAVFRVALFFSCCTLFMLHLFYCCTVFML